MSRVVRQSPVQQLATAWRVGPLGGSDNIIHWFFQDDAVDTDVKLVPSTAESTPPLSSSTWTPTPTLMDTRVLLESPSPLTAALDDACDEITEKLGTPQTFESILKAIHKEQASKDRPPALLSLDLLRQLNHEVAQLPREWQPQLEAWLRYLKEFVKVGLALDSWVHYFNSTYLRLIRQLSTSSNASRIVAYAKQLVRLYTLVLANTGVLAARFADAPEPLVDACIKDIVYSKACHLLVEAKVGPSS